MNDQVTQQDRLYRAGYHLNTYFDNILITENPVITIDDVKLTMPVETRFTSLKSIREYLADVCALDTLAHFPRAAVKVKVGYHDDSTRAVYTYKNRLISMPSPPNEWAMRELVVLHELTHHFTIGEGHGPYFAGSFLDVLGRVMGPEVEIAQRLLYDRYEVRYLEKYRAAS